MEFYVETERLILREFREEDAPGNLKLNSDPKVIKYLHMKPMKTLKESLNDIKFVTDQYEKNGIGRWTMIEKATGKYMGWSGLKIEDWEINGKKDYYDLGYRMIPEFWGKGYATESAIASIKYGFEKLNWEKIYAAAHIDNIGSQRVLEKSGMKFVNEFPLFDFTAYWYEIEKPK